MLTVLTYFSWSVKLNFRVEFLGYLFSWILHSIINPVVCIIVISDDCFHHQWLDTTDYCWFSHCFIEPQDSTVIGCKMEELQQNVKLLYVHISFHFLFSLYLLSLISLTNKLVHKNNISQNRELIALVLDIY
jgi:hypothetical protein